MDVLSTKTVADALRGYFKERGMTQCDIAESLGMTQSAISYILKGQRPISRQTAMSWSKQFGFRPQYLLTGEGPMFEQPEPSAPAEVSPDEAATVVGGTAMPSNYSIDKILEIMDRNSRTMLSQQETIAELMSELRKCKKI